MDQILPNFQSADLERAVLGALIASPEGRREHLAALEPADFAAAENRTILAGLQAAHQGEGGIDVRALAERLSREVNPEYVRMLPAQGSEPAALGEHIAILHEHALRRRAVGFAQSLQGELARAPQMPPGELIERLQGELASLRALEQRGQSTASTYADLVPEYLKALRETSEKGEEITGIRTGFHALDALTLGLNRQDLVVVAARPSMGKTTYALGLAERAALAGYQSVVFSMEMPARQLIQRSYAAIGGIDIQRLRRGRLLVPEQDRLRAATETLAELPIHVDDTPGLTLAELTARAHRIAAQSEYPLGPVVIDYLQLMTPSSSNRSAHRAEQIGEISRGIKRLARELDTPVILLSQLNRELERRPDKRPIPSDLRDSGSIEQDADIITFIYRDEVYYQDSLDRGLAEIIIAKQRNGPTGTVKLGFRGELSRFENRPDSAIEAGAATLARA